MELLIRKINTVKKLFFVEKKKIQSKLLNFIYLEKTYPFSITDFRNDIKININNLTKDDLILNITGLSLSFLNGIRRSLLSEISTICIDKVFFYYNSSFLDDELLSHRLALVPLLIVSHSSNYFFDTLDDISKKIIFEINTESLAPSQKCLVYSNIIKLKLYGIHSSWLKNLDIKPVFGDILIAKLNSGQKIKCECHCNFGNGETHAKFSGVSTAFYRIFPRIKLVNEVINDHAVKICTKCPVNVFQLESRRSLNCKILSVSQPQYCTLCRECLNFKEERKKIRIGRIREKVNFIIESTGVLSPEKLFHRAVCLLAGKCNQSMLVLLKNFINNKKSFIIFLLFMKFLNFFPNFNTCVFDLVYFFSNQSIFFFILTKNRYHYIGFARKSDDYMNISVKYAISVFSGWNLVRVKEYKKIILKNDKIIMFVPIT
nr:DNA-directed RNA polymerase 40k chain [Cryptomonas paramecium]